jgi:homoserine kinase
MSKVSVTVPAPLPSLGPGLNTIGLGLALHVHVEMSARLDDKLEITATGEGQEALPLNLRNPVMRAATRVFQKKETAPAGLSVSIENHIPLDVGLDTIAAFWMGGMVAANNLTGNSLDRDALIQLGLEAGLIPEAIVTTLLGGLNVCMREADGNIIYNSLEPPPLRVALVAPFLPDYKEKTRSALPQMVALRDAVFNMNRLSFLMDALLDADYELLEKTLQDRLYQEAFTTHIPGYEDVIHVAKSQGAAAVTLVGRGPALLVFASYNHNIIANAMVEAFQDAGVDECRFWTVPLDGQGVMISLS